MGADSTTDSRKGICLINQRDGLLIAPLSHKREITGNILADRTGINAFGLVKV
jgi:hypothetical protein